MSTHLQTLIDYIHQHGCKARIDAVGTLFVLDEYTDSDGKPGAEWTQLNATLYAVRVWLGY